MAVQHQWSSSRRHKPPQDSSCSQLQAPREAWRTVRRHRQQKGLTRHLPPCLRSRLSRTDECSVGARRCTELNALCEEELGQPDLEAFFDRAGEFYDHDTGEILDRGATIAGKEPNS